MPRTTPRTHGSARARAASAAHAAAPALTGSVANAYRRPGCAAHMALMLSLVAAAAAGAAAAGRKSSHGFASEMTEIEIECESMNAIFSEMS